MANIAYVQLSYLIQVITFVIKAIMLRKQKSKEYSLRSSSSTEENQQGHQVKESEREELSLSRTSKAEQSLDRRHCSRNYKVPFVQLLPSPRREELSLRSSLDSGLPVSYSS